MIELTQVPNAGDDAPFERIVGLQLIGRLDRKDFEILAPQLELQIEQHGKIRLLIELVDFEGWTAGAAWEDVKLAFKHFGHIERIAVIGESRWEQGMALLAKPFTAARLRYFDVEEREKAESWVRED